MKVKIETVEVLHSPILTSLFSVFFMYNYKRLYTTWCGIITAIVKRLGALKSVRINRLSNKSCLRQIQVQH